MARLRKFVAYRHLETPYTRFSKYKNKNYVRARPVCKVVRFYAGEVEKPFEYELQLVSKDDLQIRDNAIESARQCSTRVLEKALGKTGYFLQCRIYPHHVLRENPLATGAGADRMSTGMARPFGKSIGIAAQIKKGKILFIARVNKQHLGLARTALKRAAGKLPCSTSILTLKLK
ncbi:MAG: 50S ribosomal protein L16 [Candidatus Woesearchaeota archaeon]